MDPELAEKLIVSLDALADGLRLTHLYLMLLTALVVPVFVDVAFRAGWRCWVDLRRRWEARDFVDIVPVSQSQREPYRTRSRPGTIRARPPERRRPR